MAWTQQTYKTSYYPKQSIVYLPALLRQLQLRAAELSLTCRWGQPTTTHCPRHSLNTARIGHTSATTVARFTASRMYSAHFRNVQVPAHQNRAWIPVGESLAHSAPDVPGN